MEQTTQAAEETVVETETPEAQPAEVVESVPKAKFDELHGRATRAEAELKRLKQSQNPSPSDKPTVTTDQFEILALSKDYSVDELRIIEKHAKAYGVSMSEAAKDEILSGGIQAKRAQAKSVSAAPKQGRATNSLEELKKLSPAQRNENLNFEAWKQKKRMSR